jgi:7-carboxy-7-deazaguanine synthase
LTGRDEIKFVVSDGADFDWSLEIIKQHRLIERLPVLISPVFERFSPREAARQILASGLPLRLNVQLHKYIWPPGARGV